jgi:predicted extracellular nuclease
MMRRLMILVPVLLVGAAAAQAQTADLMITEYIEGAGNNKALEIFNGTEDVINLGAYSIERYSNGAETAVTIPLSAVDLAPGEAFVVTHSAAEASLLALADQTDADLNFNGNDALVLVRGGNEVIDSFGEVGFDPGNYWSCVGGTTQNAVLRRLSGVCSGDTVPDDTFDPCDEWSFFSQEVFSGLGEHIADCGAVPETPTPWGSLKSLYR